MKPAALGDPDLVTDDVYATLLWRSPVPSVGFGFGLVHSCIYPPLGPCHRCVYTDESRGKPLEGMYVCVMIAGQIW